MNFIIPLEVKLLHENFKNGTWALPNYSTVGSAAFDLIAAIDEPIEVEPFKTCFVPSGIAVWLANSTLAMLVLPRSGKGCNEGLVLGNTVGLIDSDYQGELRMCVYNRTQTTLTINPGDRIAQAMIIPKYQAKLNVVSVFSNMTDRGVGGFGSTGG